MQYVAVLALVASALAATPSVPAPSASCTPGTSYCAGDNTNIILRCDNGFIQPGNCNDNTGEPEFGALCVSYASAQASCSIVTPPTSSASIPLVTGSGVPPPVSGNGTLSVTSQKPTAPTSTATATGTGPISTGGAVSNKVGAMGAFAAALLGLAVAL